MMFFNYKDYVTTVKLVRFLVFVIAIYTYKCLKRNILAYTYIIFIPFSRVCNKAPHFSGTNMPGKKQQEYNTPSVP
jgi:hypothetical protein